MGHHLLWEMANGRPARQHASPPLNPKPTSGYRHTFFLQHLRSSLGSLLEGWSLFAGPCAETLSPNPKQKHTAKGKPVVTCSSRSWVHIKPGRCMSLTRQFRSIQILNVPVESCRLNTSFRHCNLLLPSLANPPCHPD